MNYWFSILHNILCYFQSFTYQKPFSSLQSMWIESKQTSVRTHEVINRISLTEDTRELFILSQPHSLWGTPTYLTITWNITSPKQWVANNYKHFMGFFDGFQWNVPCRMPWNFYSVIHLCVWNNMVVVVFVTWSNVNIL